ncbi:Abi-alpha family protein [Nocardia sp. XZ_19_231]|uniref:Abi-alpha family protein n=1 Tax=Nocardia sp. XZ_19_231 TaxID=2769252 RepID=UPI00188F51F5|nr:Abi-alpha family protein [Nocardia sp. XZ_19_231]
MSIEPTPDREPGIPTDLLGLARIAGQSLRHIVGAVTKGAVHTATDLVDDIRSGEPISQIFDERVDLFRRAALSALGLTSTATGVYGPVETKVDADDLKAMGDAMITEGWDCAQQPRDLHPSFVPILHDLTPDEARILRFLAVAGPQPAIDIRTKAPFGIGSQRLADGINMIAAMAGCALPDRDHHYLGNLSRLGLIRFSTEPVADFRRYAFLEAQPPAQAAYKSVKMRAISSYRSIYLTVFGKQFCHACFVLGDYTGGGWASDDRGDIYLGKGPRLP